MAKMSRQDKLSALKDKLKKTDLGGGGRGYFTPREGKSLIRILPETGDMDFFFQTVGRHFFPDKRMTYCPAFTSEGEYECPVCDLVDELHKAGDKSSKKMASALGLRKQYWMNVIDRKSPESGPLIYTPGVIVFNTIVSLIGDPDYGDIYDIEDGIDLVIEREGTGLNTEYQVIAKRHSSPLSDDPDEADKWLDKSRDLSWVIVSEDPEEDQELSAGHAIYIQPYERIVEEFGLDVYDEDDSDYEKVGTAPDDYDDDEDEDEPEPAPKREVSRRMARRSKRKSQ